MAELMGPQHHCHSTNTTNTNNDLTLMVSNTSPMKKEEYGQGNTVNSLKITSQDDQWSVSEGSLEDNIAKVLLDSFMNEQDDQILGYSNTNGAQEREDARHKELVNSIIEDEEDEEEEEIELEFERAVKKLDTHTMHCPKCNNEVTKVILRRKRRTSLSRVAPKQNKPLNLLGCLQCLAIFIPNGNCFNMLGIFGSKSSKKSRPEATDEITNHDDATDVTPSHISHVNGNTRRIQQVPVVVRQLASLMHQAYARKDHPKQKNEADVEAGDHVTVDIQNDHDHLEGDGDYQIRERGGQQTTSHGARDEEDLDSSTSMMIEMVKSIVYGGLMESITSQCIVASAAGSQATTLSIIALGLANLIGGLIIIALNLWDLKDDRNQRANKYQQVLGRRENFSLHATVAIFSYLVFGLIPPITYGFSFRTSDDRVSKILAVAATSLLCMVLLAIGKAYVEQAPKFYMYLKTIMYNVSIGFIVSGVSFAAGNLINKFIQEHGLLILNTSSPATTPILAYSY